MKMTTVRCSFCGKTFERDEATVRYRQKHGMRIYCSSRCVGRQNFSQLEKPPKGVVHPNFVAYTSLDDMSIFREFMRYVKRISKTCPRKQGDLTINDLKEQWDKQKGRCPYTGWELDGSPRTRTIENGKRPHHPKRASLDRIDSKKGYIKGNIQFVSMIAQFAKNDFSETQLLEFCEAVAQNKKSRTTEEIVRDQSGGGGIEAPSCA